MDNLTSIVPSRAVPLSMYSSVSAFDSSGTWANDHRLTLFQRDYFREFTTIRRGHHDAHIWPFDELEGCVDD